jgi:pimeloyl-ACP methyl ester carboxylesterase
MTEERFVSSFDNTELFVNRVGSGPPVVLCDGIGCDGFILHYLRPKLQDRYTLVTWHYRGHGRSAAPADPNAVGIPELRQDLTCVLDALGIEHAVLLGFSMGVQLSLDFAVRHPERVAGLVPMCGSYGQPLETFHDTQLVSTLFPFGRELVLRNPEIAQRAWSALWRSEFAYQWGTHFEVEGRLIRREAFQPYFDHLAGMDVTLFFRMLDKVRHHSVAPDLHRITAPTLIVAGERDTFTPLWLSRRMQRLIPGAEILEVPFGTHIAPLEMPELVCLRVCKFLDQRVRPLFENANPAEPAEEK